MIRTFAKLACVALLASAMTLTGCSNGGGGTGQTAGGISPSREKAVQVPADATRVKAGKLPLNFMLPTGGTIYVRNADTDRVLYHGRVPSNAVVSIDATSVAVNNRAVADVGSAAQDQRFELYVAR